MIHELQLRLKPQEAYNEKSILRYIEQEKGIKAQSLRILKRSIDARQRQVFVNLTLRAYVNELPRKQEFEPIQYPNVSEAREVVVIGAGPAGLFAALRLIELGLRPIVVERGKDVRERKKDIARIKPEQAVNPESNYSFGEGGAGAYSDGKLYTRSKKRGNTEKVLKVFVQHGASENILVEAHPHIGTDKLPRVIENMRNTIISCGGEVHFETRMERLIIHNEQVMGVVCTKLSDGTECSFESQKNRPMPVILATGHSARDVYRLLANEGIEMEAKGIAVGVRLEHPSMLIDQIQYHSREGRGKWLPAAEYNVVQQVQGRGVYSFCMCPGGSVVPAATGPQQIVVNGMSPSHRNGKWSNSGMVVEIRPEDVALIRGTQRAETLSNEAIVPQLAVMEFQEELEYQCWLQGNQKQTAPAQRMADFVNSRLSCDLNESSYAPGLIASPLHFWMPQFVSERLREAFRIWGKQKHHFLTNEATVMGVETRTSSPVRILRQADSLQHVRIKGLFPCGEGAGYAGGIVSAAVDGERCAEACAAIMG